MELRWIEGREAAEELDGILSVRGWAPLNPSSSPVITRARVAYDPAGAIAGFFVLQLFPFLGPVWIAPDSPPELLTRLILDMREFLRDSRARGWLIIAEDPRVAALCESTGMTLVRHPVYLS